MPSPPEPSAPLFAASGVDRTAGDGEAVAADAAAAVICAAATLGRQADRAAGDGEAAVAGDAAAPCCRLGRQAVIFAAGEMVSPFGLQRHVAFRSDGGTAVGLDVHLVQR